MNRDFAITDGLMRIRARNNDSITVATGDPYKHIA
jgi:adenylate cyclase class IV